MVGFAAWMNAVGLRPTRERAPKKVDVRDLLNPIVVECINGSLHTGREHGTALGHHRVGGRLTFGPGPMRVGGAAHVRIRLDDSPYTPSGTFHTHPTRPGELSGGHSDGDLAFFSTHPNCLFMLVTEILLRAPRPPGIIYHLVVRGHGKKLPKDFATLYNKMYDHKLTDADKARSAVMKEYLGTDMLAGPAGAFKPEATIIMRQRAQAESLRFVASKSGFLYYKGLDGSVILDLYS